MKKKCERCCYCNQTLVTGPYRDGNYFTTVKVCCRCKRPNPREMSWIRGDMGDKSPKVARG